MCPSKSCPSIAGKGHPPDHSGISISVRIYSTGTEIDLTRCKASCQWSDDVRDVQSTSAATGITGNFDPSSADLDSPNHSWVLHLNSDEQCSIALVRAMIVAIQSQPTCKGFRIRRQIHFLGRTLRWATSVEMLTEVRLRRMVGDDVPAALLRREWPLLKPPLHQFITGQTIAQRIDQYNQASGRVVADARRENATSVSPPGLFRGLAKVFEMFFLRLGFLDGLSGLQYCMLMWTPQLLAAIKWEEVDRLSATVKRPPNRMLQPTTPSRTRLADEVGKGDLTVTETNVKTEEASTPCDVDMADSEIAPEASPWTFREKVVRVLWMYVQATLFRYSFHNWYGWRRFLLRLFGARIGSGVRIRPTVHVEIPWKICLGDGTSIGDFAILYSLGPIEIGRRVTISQYAHLCAGTHDPSDLRFPLLRPPIRVEDEAWVAADAFVGPSVTIGRRAVVGARANVTRDVPPNEIWAGNPARFLKPRQILREA